MEKIKRIIQGDKVIWVMAILLALISMLAVYSASESYANNRFHGSNAFVLLKHSALLLAGLLAMAGTSCVQYRRYAKILSALFWVSLPLLLLTIVLGVTSTALRVSSESASSLSRPATWRKSRLSGISPWC